jgi:hypothetical protein
MMHPANGIKYSSDNTRYEKDYGITVNAKGVPGLVMNSPRIDLALRVIIIAVVLMILPSLVNGQTLKLKLAQRVAAFDSTNPLPFGQLVELAQAFRIPMGIEWLNLPDENASAPIHVRNTTILAILSQILRQYAGYTFELNDGIVHIFMPALISDERNFLNIRIPHFAVNKANLFFASYELGNVIGDVLHPRAGYGGGFGHGPTNKSGFDVPNITFAVRNSTPRGILNKIAKVQGNALWIVRLIPQQMMNNGRFYAQTSSITSDTVAPKFYWDFIPLGAL